MKLPLILFAVSGLALVAGCQESATAHASDVAEVRAEAREDNAEAIEDATDEVAEANQDVREARDDYDETAGEAHEELSATEADAMAVRARANFDVAMVEAKGRHEVAKEGCGDLTGVEKDACFSTADALHAADEAAAIATRDAALVAADYH